MGRGILRGAGGDENLKFNFIWPYVQWIIKKKWKHCMHEIKRNGI